MFFNTSKIALESVKNATAFKIAPKSGTAPGLS